MSVVRLGFAALAMAAAAVALLALGGDPHTSLRTLRRAPEIAAAGGPETVVLALTGLLAWAVWAWGAVGLLLTASTALPGLPGAVARTVSRTLVPEHMRAAAALALGMGLAVAGPAAAVPSTPPGPPDGPAAVTGSPGPPDWPSERAGNDPPGAPAQAVDRHAVDRHVVAPGECLWRIAEQHLDAAGPPPDDAGIARAVTAWWSANSEVIGPDPDLIHPGQVLLAPADLDSPGGSR